ncbi:helix-turn-helix domain-containing protein [Spongisporangium articulatum]|uniref:Helix-turn-helix domain-containing protein n=1 Tax=Spongisporangium articulatum TaxID=3362603 RepID=A0ABW8AVK3_9ACTN
MSDELVRSLGARVRALRRARGLTLTTLAAEAGLSHPFLSKLERGLAAPSMASLGQIAQALGTSQVELLAGTEGEREHPATELVRADEGPRGPYGFGEARLLAGRGRRFQPMEYRGANRDPGDFYTHAEDEFLLCTAGSALVDLGDHGRHRLGPGDSLYLSGGVPHRWCTARPDRPYRLMIVKEQRTP